MISYAHGNRRKERFVKSMAIRANSFRREKLKL